MLRISYNLNIRGFGIRGFGIRGFGIRGFGKGKSFCMRKYIASVVVALVVLFGMGSYIYKTNKIIESYENQENKESKKELLSMMLETESGSGKYQETTANEWPTEGYVFNEAKSGCENGGTLSWDDENKNVIMEGNGADKCYVYFNKKFKLYEYVKSLYTGTQGENYLYFHNGTIKGDDGTVLDANDNSYRYSGGDFQLTEKATISGLTTLDSSSNTTTNGVINFYCNGTRQYVGYSCNSSYTSYYTLQYDVTFTQYSTYKAAIKKALYDGYIKNHVNNFVCFGYDSSDGSCTTDNLYRIIGVFGNEVKMIKYDYAKTTLLGTDGAYFSLLSSPAADGSGTSKGINTKNKIGAYDWISGSGNLNWSKSNLNTINLNVNFLNNIGSKWANKITSHAWITGSDSETNIRNSIVANLAIDKTKTYDAKVGLMYISDYCYATSEVAWSQIISSYSNYTYDNWMYMGLYDWTITPNSSSSYAAIHLAYDGTFGAQCCKSQNRMKIAARPVFFLDTSVIYESGNGSMEYPYIIS